jgi:hypothetical protein
MNRISAANTHQYMRVYADTYKYITYHHMRCSTTRLHTITNLNVCYTYIHTYMHCNENSHGGSATNIVYVRIIHICVHMHTHLHTYNIATCHSTHADTQKHSISFWNSRFHITSTHTSQFKTRWQHPSDMHPHTRHTKITVINICTK